MTLRLVKSCHQWEAAIQIVRSVLRKEGVATVLRSGEHSDDDDDEQRRDHRTDDESISYPTNLPVDSRTPS